MKEKKDYELLAPAGSMGAVYGAVQSGADAIYIGGKVFSARAGAENFDNDEILKVVEYCHLRDVKVYVTLNTLIKQSELNEALSFAHFLYKAGVDAVIVQDFGIAHAILKMHPDFKIHASTQMTIHNSEDARVLKDCGFDRIVLARELSLEEIREINDTPSYIAKEVFVHGAICQSYSGQCLFSSVIGQRSGNRGKCAQPCRLEYELSCGNKSRKGYLLSPKDMCLINHIAALKNSGVFSFKIEGRLKKPEYVATVTKIYSDCLESGKPASKKDYDALLAAFNRSGFTDGYLKGELGEAMMTYKNPSNIAKEVFDDEAKKRCLPACNIRKIPVKMILRIMVGEKASLRIFDDCGNMAIVFGDVVEEARSVGVTEEFALKQISRLGDTVYTIEDIEMYIDENAGFGAKDFNDLRRRACEEFSCVRLKKYKRAAKPKSMYKVLENGENNKSEGDFLPVLTASVSNIRQAKAASELGISRIYAKKEIIESLKEENGGKLKGRLGDSELVLKQPDIMKEADIKKNESKTSASDYEGKILSPHVAGSEIGAYGDFRLNVYNNASVKSYKKLGFETVCISPELNLREIRGAISKSRGCEIIGYGRLPLMIMKNCIIRAALGRCMKNQTAILKDRRGERFMVRCESDMCVNTILNSKPLYMADKAKDLISTGADFIRLVFTDESEKECRRVIEAYKNALSGREFENAGCFVENGFTRGHFYRGAK